MFTPGQVPSAKTPAGKALHQYILMVLPQADGLKKCTTKLLDAATVIVAVDVLAPSVVLAVIATVPAAMPVTSPVALTVAMAVFADAHVTD